MKTYLVTGGAGFIGSNFIHYMLKKYEKKDIRIINFDKLTYAGNLENLKEIENEPNYIFVQGDICDKAILETLLSENEIDYVVNFAAESHVDRSIQDPEIFIKTNVLGTATLYWTHILDPYNQTMKKPFVRYNKKHEKTVYSEF